MTVGCSLCSNTEGLQPDLSGESGKGKSDACKAVLHLMPQDYVFKGSRSTLALFHEEYIPEGSVIFLDDVGTFSEKEEQLIKTISSQYQAPYTHTYTDMKMTGAKKAQTVSLPRGLTFWITSVSSSFDVQIGNRYLKMTVDESIEQDIGVFDRQKESAKNGTYRLAETEGVEISRRLIRHLKELFPVTVVIPFVDYIEWKGIENRRNFPMFCDIIRTSAVFNQYRRTRLPNGSIVASLEDYDRAERLWAPFERAQTTGLTKVEQLVFDTIKKSGLDGITQSELRTICGKDKGTISHALFGIKQKDFSYKGGLMNKIKSGLVYDEYARSFHYSGIVKDDGRMVSLSNRDEAQALIDSYRKEVAEPSTPQITA
jgi:hypothetical protein